MRETGYKEDEDKKIETGRKINEVSGETLYAVAVRPIAKPPMVTLDLHNSFWKGQQPG